MADHDRYETLDELPSDDHVLISMRGNAKLLLKEDYEKKEIDKLNEVKFDDVEFKYLSQYLLYKDRKQMVTLEEQASVVRTVEQCVSMVVNRLNKHTDFFGGKLMRCGSFFEDTKVGNVHEFDFQYILTLRDFKAEIAHMSKLKAKNSNLDSKTFFRLYKKKGTKGTKEEETETEVVEQLGEEIIAKDKHDSFKLAVEGILKDLFDVNDKIIMTKKSGPAVKFVLTIPYKASKNRIQGDLRYVKVDLTLAYQPKPAEEFIEQLQLRSDVTSLRENKTLKCQFIPAHDFWKLSFTQSEKSLMRTVAGVDMKGVCYRAIKILRDEVDVQNFLGDGILASYPIKVTHIKRTMDTLSDQIWTKEKVGENVINIVKAVERDGHNQKLHGLFLCDDNVVGESDKSYMESRRIINELKYVSTGFKRYALVNLIIWALLLFASTGLVVSEIVAWSVTDWFDLEMNCFNFAVGVGPPFPLDLPFLFAFSIFVWIVLLSNLAGIFLVSVVTAKWEKDIFKVLPNLRYVFSVNLGASCALCVFDIFLIHDFVVHDSCTRVGNRIVIELVAGVSVFITSIPYYLLLISCISSSTYHRRMCYKGSAWDVLFFEFPFCREHVRRSEVERLNKARLKKGFKLDEVMELRVVISPEDVLEKAQV